MFGYLRHKFTTLIKKELGNQDKLFIKFKREDDDLKQKHLKLFRPNLENPANKQITMELNQKENERTEKFKEHVDEF